MVDIMAMMARDLKVDGFRSKGKRKAPQGPAFRIRQNKWDNWYGYKSGRRVIGFTNGTTETMEEQAKRWLRERQDGNPAWAWEEK